LCVHVLFFQCAIFLGCTISDRNNVRCFAQAKLNLVDYASEDEYMHKNGLHLIHWEYLPGCLYR